MTGDARALQAELAVARSLRNKVDVLTRFALAFQKQGNLKQAIALSEQAIGLAMQAEREGQPNRDGLADSLALLGECLLDVDKSPQALDALLRALKAYEELGDQRQIARLHLLVGMAYLDLEEPFGARKHFSEGVRLSREVDDRRLLAENLKGHGGASLALKDGQGALSSLLESLQVFREMDESLGQAQVLGSLSRAYASLGDYENSLDRGQRGVELCIQAGLRVEEVGQLIDLGEIYLQQGNQERAIACYQDALALAQTRDLLDREAQTWCRLSEVYSQQQQQAKLAVSAASRALEITQTLDESKLLVECHRSLAAAHRLAGEYGLALEHFEQAWVLRERLYTQEMARLSRRLEVIHQVELDTARKEVVLHQGRIDQLERELRTWHKVERLLHEREERNKALIDGLPIGFYRVSPDGRVFDVNATALRLLGRAALEGFLDREPTAESQEASRRRALRRQLERQDRIDAMETVIQQEEGEPLVIREHIRAVRDDGGALLFYEGVLEDITRQKQTETSLQEVRKILDLQSDEIGRLQSTFHEQVVRDPLTGLFNRRYLLETLERELARSRRKRRSLSLLLLDIDNFSKFNDTHGHFVGDRMLQALGDLLGSRTRGEDVVSRIEVDKFVILLMDAPIQVAFEKANNFRLDFGAYQLLHHGKALQSTLSAGVVAYPQHGVGADELLQNAEQALQVAKQGGRNRVHVLE